MAKFIRKAQVVEAVQFLGNDRFSEWPDWMEKAKKEGTITPFPNYVLVDMGRAKVHAAVNDFLVWKEEVEHQIFVFNPADFKQKYALAE